MKQVHVEGYDVDERVQEEVVGLVKHHKGKLDGCSGTGVFIKFDKDTDMNKFSVACRDLGVFVTEVA